MRKKFLCKIAINGYYSCSCNSPDCFFSKSCILHTNINVFKVNYYYRMYKIH